MVLSRDRSGFDGRTVLATALLGLLVVTAGCVGGVPGARATEGPATDSPSITVSASGQVEVEPDQAVVVVAVVATDPDPNAVREQLASDADRLRTALDEAGVADDQVRTVEYRIREDHRKDEAGAAYRGVHAFEVTLDDVDAVGSVVDAAVGNGASRVQGVRFTLSEAAREKAREQALQRAMDTARSRADVLADSGGLSVVGVRSVTTADVGFVAHRAEALAAAGDAGGTTIDSGPVTVTATVRVTFDAN